MGGMDPPTGKGTLGWGHVLDTIWTMDESYLRSHQTQPITYSKGVTPLATDGEMDYSTSISSSSIVASAAAAAAVLRVRDAAK